MGQCMNKKALQTMRLQFYASQNDLFSNGDEFLILGPNEVIIKFYTEIHSTKFFIVYEMP